jgi:hypothetical protein
VLLTSVVEAPDVLDMAALEPWALHITPVGPMRPEAAADMMLEAGLRSAHASSGASVKLLTAALETPGVKEKTAELAFAAGGTPLGIMCGLPPPPTTTRLLAAVGASAVRFVRWYRLVASLFNSVPPSRVRALRSAAGAALSASLSAAPELSATAMGPFIAAACRAISAQIDADPAAASRPGGRSSTAVVSGRASTISLATEGSEARCAALSGF